MHINNNNQLKYNITVVTHHCKGECLHDDFSFVDNTSVHVHDFNVLLLF